MECRADPASVFVASDPDSGVSPAARRKDGKQNHMEIFQMTSMTLIHLIGLPTSLLAQFSMVAFVPMIGALMIATVASDRVSES